MSDSLIPEIPDFGDPLGVLRACHERMLAQCATLEKLPEHIARRGVDDQALSAMTRAVQYFSTSAVQHHQDEEDDLFPLLLEQDPELVEMLDQLRQEHKQLAEYWDALATLFDEPDRLVSDTAYQSQIKAFCDLYRAHIRFENNTLLNSIEDTISTRQRQQLGYAMKQRRSLSNLK